MNMQKAQKAKDFFMQGYNCSQSVLAAWCEEVGLDMQTALKISSGFGAGMGRMREVCGAVTGAFMVLSLRYGSTDPKNPKAKGETYELIQKFAKRFKEENNFDSIICREMLGLNGASKPQPEARTTEYYKKRPCAELVALSSGLLGEFIETREDK